jgi:adenine-specific DNA-methyltransferase
LANLTTQTTLFEMSKKEKSAWSKKVETLTKETKKLETEINEIRDNQIYENAFEWRFEFPEVLNDAGDFTGFDVVIGNPPYLSGASFREFHNFFNTRFEVAEYQLDLYTFFIELSNLILRPNAYLAFITPSSWLKNIKMGKTRKYFLNNFQAISINPNISKAFEEAQVDTLIVLSHKTSMVSSLDTTTSIWSFNNENQVEVKHKINQEYFRGNQSFCF